MTFNKKSDDGMERPHALVTTVGGKGQNIELFSIFKHLYASNF